MSLSLWFSGSSLSVAVAGPVDTGILKVLLSGKGGLVNRMHILGPLKTS